MMLIGQWAEAAHITREQDGLVCAYASGGGELTPSSACGYDEVTWPYCWKRGEGCCAGCGTSCCYQFCHPESVCTLQGQNYEAPVLCVK